MKKLILGLSIVASVAMAGGYSQNVHNGVDSVPCSKLTVKQAYDFLYNGAQLDNGLDSCIWDNDTAEQQMNKSSAISSLNSDREAMKIPNLNDKQLAGMNTDQKLIYIAKMLDLIASKQNELDMKYSAVLRQATKQELADRVKANPNAPYIQEEGD